MEDSYCCPNFNVCKLVDTSGFTGDEDQRKQYIQSYCRANELKWNSCKRLITKYELHFCPDFVLPDTPLSVDEIMDKFDEGDMNN